MRMVAVITPPGIVGTVHLEDNNPAPGPSNALSPDGITPLILSDLTFSAIHIRAKGYQPYNESVQLPPGNKQLRIGIPDDPNYPDDIVLPALTPLTHGRLTATEHGFRFEDGTPYRWAHADSFRAKERLGLGESIDDVLDDLVDVGANGIRVLDDASWFRWHSSADIPRALGAIDMLADRLRVRQMVAQYCIFADWQQTWGGDLGRAQDYYAQVIEHLRRYEGFVGQLVNEGNQHGQNFPTAAFTLPDGILFSPGSNGTGDNPPQPFGRGLWGYNDLGSERNTTRLALSTTTVFFAVNGYAEGRDSFPGTQWSTVVSEPPGIGDTDPGGSTRNGDVGVAYLLGLGTVYDPQGRACGGTAHADDCIQTQRMRPLTKACVTAFLRGVMATTR